MHTAIHVDGCGWWAGAKPMSGVTCHTAWVRETDMGDPQQDKTEASPSPSPSHLQRSQAVSGGKEPSLPVPETTRQQQEVVAHVYDVCAASGSDATVLHINRIFKDAIGLGGIFHTAIQVYGEEEWSFGYCENGSGVFSCPPGKNPMYTFRESIVLGKTSCSIFTVNQIVRELSWEWPGGSYELLSRNCNHFCNELCDKLDVPKLPGWINRFANAGDAALEVAETTAVKLKQAKKEIFSACKAASTYLTGATPSTLPSDVEDTGGSTSNPLFEGTWIRNIIGMSMKPSKSLMNDASSSSDDETSDDESESDGKQPDGEQNEDQKDAAEEQDTDHTIIHEAHTISVQKEEQNPSQD